MMVVECFHHFTKGAPYKQPHVLWLDVELSSQCRFPLPHQAMRNGAITPCQPIRTRVWKRYLPRFRFHHTESPYEPARRYVL